MAKMVEKWAKSGCTGAAARARTHGRVPAPMRARSRRRVRRCARRGPAFAQIATLYTTQRFSRGHSAPVGQCQS